MLEGIMDRRAMLWAVVIIVFSSPCTITSIGASPSDSLVCKYNKDAANLRLDQATKGYNLWRSDPWNMDEGDPGMSALSIFDINCDYYSGPASGYYDFVQVTEDERCVKTFNTETVHTFHDYISRRGSSNQHSDSFSMEAHASGWGVNLDASAAFSHSSSSEYSSLKKLFTEFNGEITLAMAKCLFRRVAIVTDTMRPKFSREFIRQLFALNDTLSQDDISAQDGQMKRFIQQFGTHYSTETIFGSELIYEQRYNSSSKSSHDTEERSACAASTAKGCAGAGYKGFGFSGSVKMCGSNKASSCDSSGFDDTWGRDTGIQSSRITTIGSAPKSFEDWGSTIDDFKPVPMRRKLALMSNLFSTDLTKNDDFGFSGDIDGNGIAQIFKRVAEKYCEVVMGKKPEECSDYLSGCGLNSDCALEQSCINSKKSIKGYYCTPKVYNVGDYTQQYLSHSKYYKVRCGEDRCHQLNVTLTTESGAPNFNVGTQKGTWNIPPSSLDNSYEHHDISTLGSEFFVEVHASSGVGYDGAELLVSGNVEDVHFDGYSMTMDGGSFSCPYDWVRSYSKYYKVKCIGKPCKADTVSLTLDSFAGEEGELYLSVTEKKKGSSAICNTLGSSQVDECHNINVDNSEFYIEVGYVPQYSALSLGIHWHGIGYSGARLLVSGNMEGIISDLNRLVIDVGNATLLNASSSKCYKVMCDGICGATGIELTILSTSGTAPSNLKVYTDERGLYDICRFTSDDLDLGVCNNTYVGSSEFFILMEAPHSATYNMAELKIDGNVEYVVNAGVRTVVDVGDGEYLQRFYTVGDPHRLSSYNITLHTASGAAGLFVGTDKGYGDMCTTTSTSSTTPWGVKCHLRDLSQNDQFYITVHSYRYYTRAKLIIDGYGGAIASAGQSDDWD